jgi:hypothetical protein
MKYKFGSPYTDNYNSNNKYITHHFPEGNTSGYVTQHFPGATPAPYGIPGAVPDDNYYERYGIKPERKKTSIFGSISEFFGGKSSFGKVNKRLSKEIRYLRSL